MLKARTALIAVSVAICVLGLGSVLGVRALNAAGLQALGMKSSSMTPAIAPGDLVVSQPVPVGEVRAGDVITFQRSDEGGAPYTHRVVRVVDGPGGPEFVTKGDANGSEDLGQVRYEGTAWRLAHVVPNGSLLLLAVQSPLGRAALAGSLFVLTLALIWPVLVGESSRREPIAEAVA